VLATSEETFEHFCVRGWMRVRAAFSVHEAAAMRTVVWRALARVGIVQTDPSTWTTERPERLQHLKGEPAFDAVGSPQLLKAIDAAHDGVSLQVVENTGTAGDVILLHPLVLHVATPNTSDAPRFLLSAGVDLPSMWAM